MQYTFLTDETLSEGMGEPRSHVEHSHPTIRDTYIGDLLGTATTLNFNLGNITPDHFRLRQTDECKGVNVQGGND